MRALVGAGLLAILASRACAGEPTPVELIRNGEAVCSLVLADNPTPAARLASLEIQYHFLKMFGAEIPLRKASDKVEGARILVGESEATQGLGFRESDFAPQEYAIALRPKTVILIGRDWPASNAATDVVGRPMSGGDTLELTRHRIPYWKTVGYPERDQGEIELPGLYDDQGTCLATYDFLERYAGVRWYGPTEDSMVLPRSQSLSVAGEDVRRSPKLKQRNALASGNWPFMRTQWGEVSQPQIQLHWRRLRLGGERWACNHTFHRQTIASTFRDPAYQCANPKGFGSQLCYTNPKLVEQVAQMARDYFDGKSNPPDGWKALGDYFAIVPDDNANFCQCRECQKLLKQGEPRKTGYFNSGEASEYWFTFVNRVAREVRKTHPDKYIATLGYWLYAVAPDIELEPNVSIAPCLGTCAFPANPAARDSDLQLFAKWLTKTQAPMFMWVYYHHPMEPALIDRWKCFPHIMVHQTADNMRRFMRDGVRGIFVCGEQDQLEHYVMVKVWDDPDRDVDELVNEFFRLYFGAAADSMREFYVRLEQVACDPDNYPPASRDRDRTNWRAVAWNNLGTAERMQQFEALISRAEKQAQSPSEKERVSRWRHAFWDWMQSGRQEYLAGQSPAQP